MAWIAKSPLLAVAVVIGFVSGCGGVASDGGATGSVHADQSGSGGQSVGGSRSIAGEAAGSTGGDALAGAGGNPLGTGGTEASCSDVEPCGGDVVGTWIVVSSCLAVTGELDVSGLGLACTSVAVSGSLQVTGTWTANTDGTHTDGLTWLGEQQLDMEPQCFQNTNAPPDICARVGGALPVLGEVEGLAYSSLGCEGAAPTESGCTCMGTVEQDQNSEVGTFTATAGVVTTSGGLEFSYCRSGNTLVMTPLRWSPDTSMTPTGTVLFQQPDSVQ